MFGFKSLQNTPMQPSKKAFPDVTLLITHYNRSLSLNRLLKSFFERKIFFGNIVVSDDGSSPEHLVALYNLKTVFNFELVCTPINKGLGNNINKGQDAVNTPFTLYVQEDFVPKHDFIQVFSEGLNIMQTDAQIDIIRFYSYFPYPYIKPYKNNFEEMIFHSSPRYANHLKFYLYSDHPHLRRSNFLQKFGRYPEGIKGDATEFGMAISVLKNKGRALLYKPFSSVFDQLNSADEPSTMVRNHWRQKKTPAVIILRTIYLPYRLLKNTWQYFMHKKNSCLHHYTPKISPFL